MKLLNATALILAALVPSSASAQDRAYEHHSDAELNAIIADQTRSWEVCETGVPVSAELRRRDPDNYIYVWLSIQTQIACADKREAYDEGKRLAAEAERLFEEGAAYSLYFEAKTADVDAIARRFRTADNLELLGQSFAFREAVAAFGRRKRSAEFDQIALGWHDQNRLHIFVGDIRDMVAVQAIKGAISAERYDLLEGLLSHVSDPQMYIHMLENRTFFPVWDLSEQRAGPNLALVSRSHADSAVARMNANRADPKLTRTAVRALLTTGHFEEVIAIAEEWHALLREATSISDGEGTISIDLAHAYDAVGQPEKADAVFDDLLRFELESQPWVVEFAAGSASRLISQHRWAEGLEVAELARPHAEKFGIDSAKATIARDLACAYSALGRHDEASKEVSFLEQEGAQAEIRAQAMMCMGDRQGAAAVMLAGLRGGRSSRAVSFLQRPEFETFYPPSLLPSPHELLAESPELMEELNRHGRLLPERFTPLPHLKRKQWLIPRVVNTAQQ